MGKTKAETEEHELTVLRLAILETGNLCLSTCLTERAVQRAATCFHSLLVAGLWVIRDQTELTLSAEDGLSLPL